MGAAFKNSFDAPAAVTGAAAVSVFDMPVFGPADVFPMMSDEELQDLAADIRENGLQEPLVVGEIADEEGVITDYLIDGRNRLAACKIAGMEPEVRRLKGEDPTAFLLSANILRRHMTKGQRAMAVAMLYPKTQYGKEGQIRKNCRFGARYLDFGRNILAYAPDFIPNVLTGAISLDDAYTEAKWRRDAATSTEARIAALRERSPELADKVVEGELSLSAAVLEADNRETADREVVQSLLLAVDTMVRHAAPFTDDANVKALTDRLPAKGTLDQLAGRLRCTKEEIPEKIEAMRLGAERVAAVFNSVAKTRRIEK
jgi:hypothetical protein